jgi:hypothetical protein
VSRAGCGEREGKEATPSGFHALNSKIAAKKPSV